MTADVSPLELVLDDENPRFIVLSQKEQSDIRSYLATFEDVCALTNDINSYGNLLPGERIVVLMKGDKYVVVEGNRRTCCLQMLLNRSLIPNGFEHKIPSTSIDIIKNCSIIQVDIVPNREAAIELMSKRHIDGVKQWRPLAKKQFFASNYQLGRRVENLTLITGISVAEIKKDIRDYKFFQSAYAEYYRVHTDNVRDIIQLKIDPFLRIFQVKFSFNGCSKLYPSKFLKMTYDDNFNTISELDKDLFNQIVQLVFEETTITANANTRDNLSSIEGIEPLLKLVVSNDTNDQSNPNDENNHNGNSSSNSEPETTSQDSSKAEEEPEQDDSQKGNNNSSHKGSSSNEPTTGGSAPGGPTPGGPAPRTFFETISWHGKVHPEVKLHEGLINAINELYILSTSFTIVDETKVKSYERFPIATGMILRTAYEQALKLRLHQVNLWGTYYTTYVKGVFPTLKTMEQFADNGTYKPTIFPTLELNSAFNIVMTYSHREFLNANIHNPGEIKVSPDALVGIAQAGMFSLIQGLINLLP